MSWKEEHNTDAAFLVWVERVMLRVGTSKYRQGISRGIQRFLFCKGSELLLLSSSRAARVAVRIGSIPTLLCNFYGIYLKFTSMAAGRRLDAPLVYVMGEHYSHC